MSNGWSASTTTSIRAAPTSSTPRSAATGPACATVRSRPAMPASARRPRAPVSPPRISRSRVQRSTACAASCSSTASSRRGSPRASRWRGRCARNYAKMNSPRRNGMLGTRTLIGAAAFTLAFAAQAQTKWDMPTPYSDGEFHTRNVRTFVEDVQKASGGKLAIQVHSHGSLIKHPDILRAVSTGPVTIACFVLSQFGKDDPIFEAHNLPFVAAGFDPGWLFYQAQKPVLEKHLASRGLTLLYSVAWPGQGIYTKEPLKSVADLKGTKFRTYSPLTARLAELLGASPTVVQVPDVPQMFATGAIQAMITSSATGTQTKAGEVVKNYYTTNAFHPKNVVVVNARAFERLNAGQKKALTDAASKAETRGWAMSKVRELEANEGLAKNGMSVRAPDAAMMAAFEKIGAQMTEEWQKTAGPEGLQVLKAYRGK